MRILNVCSNRWNSAITEYALSTTRALSLCRAEVVTAVLAESPLEKRLQDLGLASFGFTGFSIGQSLKAKDLLSKIKPHVIITHGGPETMMFGLVSSGATPLIRVRGYAFDGSGALSGLTHDLGQWGAKAIVVPGKKLEKEINLASKIPTHTVTLGIDTERFKPTSQETLKRPELLIFGRFDPVKGHAVFMTYFSEVLKLWTGSEKPLLRIVGLPANISETHLKEDANNIGLNVGEDVIISSERVVRPENLMGRVTCGVIPSLGSELICRVAEEFLACGTPVIVSGVGSLEDVLIKSNFGTSYEGKTKEEIPELIKASLEEFHRQSPVHRLERAKDAAQLFSLKTMSEAWSGVISSVVH